MSKFSLANATPGKRASEELTDSPKKSKIPKVSDLKKDPPREKTERVTTSGPLKICVYKYSDSAGDLWNQFKDAEDTPLYQIQVEHDARPSVTINIVAQFNEFLKSKNDESIDTLQKLKAAAGIALVLTNAEDPDETGTFVMYRAAWYIAGQKEALANFFALFDDGR